MQRTLLAVPILLIASLSPAATTPAELSTKTKPSVVAIQFTYAGELMRQDVVGMGVVVREDGLTICSVDLTPRGIPDEQMTDFKMIRPGDIDSEVDAEFVGRDERYNLTYIRPKASDKPWQPVQFADAKIGVGDTVYGVGVLPRIAGYNVYVTRANIAALLKGPVPQALVDGGGLSVIGSPVFNADGQAIGFVNSQPDRTLILNDPRNAYATVDNPTRLFTPASDFLPSLANPPTSEKPVRMAFLGVAQLTGLTKDVADYYGLNGQVAIQVGDVIPGFAADRAGLKKGDIIVQLDGQPLERGDLPEENPFIFTRRLVQKNVGDTVTLSVLKEKGKPQTEVKVTLDERPVLAAKAKRFYAEDLGFAGRDLVFDDTYSRKLAKDAPGMVIALVRPQSAAQAAELQNGDLVQQINQTPVANVEQFKTEYRKFRSDKPRDAVVLEVLRQGATQIIRIEPPRE